MRLLAIDPGPVQSAYVIWDEEKVLKYGKVDNPILLDAIMVKLLDADAMVVERIASYGMAVGEEVFETVYWTGRFIQAMYARMLPCYRLPRKDVKINLCGSMKAKDSNIRQALIDRLGNPGTKKNPGPTYGLAGDTWAALAVAVTWCDQQKVYGRQTA